MLEKDDRYVTRSEWIDGTGKIYERINSNDRKHSEAISELKNTVEKQTVYQKMQFESQERQEKHLSKISDSMNAFSNEFTDIKYKVRTHTDQLDNINKSIMKKQKGNVQITGIIIGGIFSIIVAAIGLAQYLF